MEEYCQKHGFRKAIIARLIWYCWPFLLFSLCIARGYFNGLLHHSLKQLLGAHLPYWIHMRVHMKKKDIEYYIQCIEEHYNCVLLVLINILVWILKEMEVLCHISNLSNWILSNYMYLINYIIKILSWNNCLNHHSICF